MLAYKIEYETTDITLDDLAFKYSIHLGDTSGWVKEPHLIQPVVTPATIVMPTTPRLPEITPLDDREQLLADILAFKKGAIEHAKKFMAKDVAFCEVKEFKDMVSVVTNLEQSLIEQKQTGPVVNILVQNLVERFKDDC